MILDKALGEEIGTIHSRTELRKMLEIHVQHQAVDEESGKVMDGYV
jgi:metal transporter CNNM